MRLRDGEVENTMTYIKDVITASSPTILSVAEFEIEAGVGITEAMIASNSVILVKGSGGAVTISATPSIADGYDRQVLYIIGNDETNTVKLQDASNLAYSGMNLKDGEDFTLDKAYLIGLYYSADDKCWYELTRSTNLYTPQIMSTGFITQDGDFIVQQDDSYFIQN